MIIFAKIHCLVDQSFNNHKIAIKYLLIYLKSCSATLIPLVTTYISVYCFFTTTQIIINNKQIINFNTDLKRNFTHCCYKYHIGPKPLISYAKIQKPTHHIKFRMSHYKLVWESHVLRSYRIHAFWIDIMITK